MTVLDTSLDAAALFVRQARATPEAVALEDQHQSLTYAQLESETGRLANRLARRPHSVGRDVLVGVLMGRCAENVIASLAALRAGGAFLVLELAYPNNLLADVIKDAKPAVIVTLAAHAHRVKGSGVPVIILDSDEEKAERAKEQLQEEKVEEDDNTPPRPADDDVDRLAFVCYSSGTTGRPKGISNPHRAAVGSYSRRFGVSSLGPGDRVACNVFFVWEMLRPLLRGATTVAVPDVVSYDPEALVTFLSERAITDTLMTSTLLDIVLARHDADVGSLAKRLGSLRSLWLNGEVVTADLCRKARAALPSHTRLLNVYSTSETHEVAAGELYVGDGMATDICPVGAPLLDGDEVLILDGDTPVEAGEVGELCVGGPLLARGYLNLPEVTAKAFFLGPGGQRMYRTGDAARRLSDGRLEITGRIGGMIKTRGYTVQPGAVEAAIMRHLSVRSCVVVGHGEGLEKRIVAYVVRDVVISDVNRPPLVIRPTGHSPEARRALSAHLAHYMIPSVWIELDALPTHDVSGKIDVRALPTPAPTRPASPTAASSPRGGGGGAGLGTQPVDRRTIADAWAASLGLPLDQVDTAEDHSFFDLGGHSLSLADLAGRLSKLFGFSVPLAPLAAQPSLEGHLAVALAARDGHVAGLQADLPAMLRADCVLPDDVVSPAARPRRPTRLLGDAKTVVLTGATGYLGAFLLRALHERSTATIVCLIRFAKVADDCRPAGIARIRANLVDLGLWHDGLLDRLEVVPANLSAPLLGLSQAEFDDLGHRADVIVHGAATVNLVYPYAALRDTNVGGTREMLRLASVGGATFHHVSSNGALPGQAAAPAATAKSNGAAADATAADATAAATTAWAEDARISVDDAATGLADGYGQTKWVAEQLVAEARARGMPATVYRLGTLSGSSRTGAANAYDMLNALVVESLRMGCAPVIESWRVEMTPVDHVAEAIAALADVDDQQHDALPVYHLVDSDPVPAAALFDRLARLGYATKRAPWDAWVVQWRERTSTRSPLASAAKQPFTVDILRGGLPTVDALTAVALLDDAATQARLEQHGLARPKLDDALWQTYLRHFYARGWLSSPPRRRAGDAAARGGLAAAAPVASTSTIRGGRLAGRVAVVTGASSGIGEAVAVALAREGAKVAIAARRKDALEGVRSRMPASPDAVLVQPTDVTDAGQVAALMDATAKQLGPVDILVSCAGVMYFTMMANVKADEWDRTVDVNCKGLLHCLASTVPAMLARGAGHIVAISSDAGRKVFPGLGVYSASKFFVEATLQSLRLETAGSGLRVTSVQPGNVATELLSMSTDAEAIEKYGQPSGAKVLDPSDVASAIVYALGQPAHVAVNEVLIEPRDEPI
ncbi:acetyl-CoA synthetase-like protein [Acaromyces ingoldii]|uniref:Acetyl-CoA synthetase-like protein n=1 Tax=Acaromyces ingoldii TaxID=215250 RepID=A0A316YM90_9BASI|nr:acetyl-CoA synthetase-like protein [Acaromyces ingoldii]PWN88855.1 acetyl-CoA synthetase-like protein [Acaromyces ingoldii]